MPDASSEGKSVVSLLNFSFNMRVLPSPVNQQTFAYVVLTFKGLSELLSFVQRKTENAKD